MLLDNCYPYLTPYGDLGNLEFKKATLEGTDFYKVLYDEDLQIPVLHEISSFSSSEIETITLQPL